MKASKKRRSQSEWAQLRSAIWKGVVWLYQGRQRSRDRKLHRRYAATLPPYIDAAMPIVRIAPPDGTSPYADFNYIGTNEHGFLVQHDHNPPIVVTYLMMMSILNGLSNTDEDFEGLNEVDSVRIRQELKTLVGVVEGMGMSHT
jgi:hypothetical protein